MGKPLGISTLSIDEPLIFEKGSPGRSGVSLPDDTGNDTVHKTIPKKFIRDAINDFPELSQVEIVRHYTRLSQYNYSVDMGFYPLGSCTMKYNPKINEEAAKLRGFSFIHPLQPEQLSQGAMRLMFELERFLAGFSSSYSGIPDPHAIGD